MNSMTYESNNKNIPRQTAPFPQPDCFSARIFGRLCAHASRLRRVAAILLFGLPLLLGAAAEANAQTDLGVRFFIAQSGIPLPEGATMQFNFALSRRPKSHETITIPLTLGGTATQGTDYRIVCIDSNPVGTATCHKNGEAVSVTFHGGHSRWRSSFRITAPLKLQAIEDHTVEAEEIVTMGLDLPPFEIPVVDSPPTTTLSFSRGSYRAGEGDLAIQPVVNINSPSGRELTIPLIFTDITAEAGRNYEKLAETVVPPTGAVTFSFNVNVHDDNLANNRRSFRVAFDTARLPAGVNVGAIPEAIFTIEDNDPPPSDPPELNLEVLGSRVVDEGRSTTFRVTANKNMFAGNNNLSKSFRLYPADFIHYLKTSGYKYVETSEFDYTVTVSPKYFTFQAGALPQQSEIIEVTIADDKVDNPNGYLKVEIPGGCWHGDCSRFGVGSDAEWFYYRGRSNEVILEIRDNDKAGSGAPAIEVPDTPVSNLQLTAIDDGSASASWDAVDHATGYDVEWDSLAGDPPGSIGGGAMRVAGTTATINHFAAEAMTLNVTVTPEYIDGNGDTRRLDDLAATATLDVGPAGTETAGDPPPDDHGLVAPAENPAPLQDYSKLIATVQGYAAETHNGPDHVYRWLRTLAALDEENGHAPLSAAEARQMSAIYSSNRWDPVANALAEIEAAQTGADASPEPLVCVSPQLWSNVKDYSKETWQGPVHVERWLRVLHTFAGTANDSTIMLSKEAQSFADRGWNRWIPVTGAIKCLERQALQNALSQ